MSRIYSTSSSIKVWSLNFTHKKYIQSFKAHLTPVTALYQLSNSDIVLSGSKDGEIILWDINQMKQIQIFKPHVDAITSIIEVSSNYMIKKKKKTKLL